MAGGAGVTIYDIIVIGLFAVLIGRGIWLGFLRQITGLVALYLGYIVASQYHDKFFPFLREISDSPEVVFLASYALMFIATYIVIVLLGKFMAHAVQVSIVGWFDRILGGVLGCAKALIIVVLLHMVLGVVLPPESKVIRNCQTCEPLNEAVVMTSQLIRSDEVRKALKKRNPAISIDAVKGSLAPISSAIPKVDDSGKAKQDAGKKQPEGK